MADKLMGEDPCKGHFMHTSANRGRSSVTDHFPVCILVAQAAHTKYALVCGGCFRHNGLVGGGKEEWEKTRECVWWKRKFLIYSALHHLLLVIIDRVDLSS
jgi:hypothetical protein